MSKHLIFYCLIVFSLSCGVRGRPQPPKTPAEIGRGQPTFSRAMKTIDATGAPNKEPDTPAKKVTP